MSLVLRYYYDGAVQESFLQFEHADKLDAAGLTEKIVNTLQGYGLEYREQLIGQGYDGASVMSGRHSGVSARIQALAKHAFYVHCNAHCLNLVDASCFFSLLQRLLCLDHMYTKSGRTYSAQCILTISLESCPNSVMLGGHAGFMPVETLWTGFQLFSVSFMRLMRRTMETDV